MFKLAMLILAVTTAPAVGQEMVCTAEPANTVLDTLQSRGEVPILRMTVAGNVQALLVANPGGDFVLFIPVPDGRACILAIGHDMRKAQPNERFLAERSP